MGRGGGGFFVFVSLVCVLVGFFWEGAVFLVLFLVFCGGGGYGVLCMLSVVFWGFLFMSFFCFFFFFF